MSEERGRGFGRIKVILLLSVSAIVTVAVGCVLAAAGRPVAAAVACTFIAVVAAAVAGLVGHAFRHAAARFERFRARAAKSEQHCVEVLRRIIRLVEARDHYWRGHSEHVARLAGQIAENLGLPPEQCRRLTLAGQLHDIGLLAMPDGLMTSRQSFGVDELRCVMRHSVVSYEVLKPLELLRDILPLVRHHHERLNGTGYPDGLRGDDIPLGARILAVADAYDAMTHDRPYRDAMTPVQAVSELRRCTPAGYDGKCVAALAKILGLSEQPSETALALGVAVDSTG